MITFSKQGIVFGTVEETERVWSPNFFKKTFFRIKLSCQYRRRNAIKKLIISKKFDKKIGQRTTVSGVDDARDRVFFDLSKCLITRLLFLKKIQKHIISVRANIEEMTSNHDSRDKILRPNATTASEAFCMPKKLFHAN